VSEQLALLPGYLRAHLELTLVALAIGASFSIPLGIALTRRPRFEGPVLGVASVIQTIPSLAMLAIMVPTLAALAGVAASFGVELRSIGYVPALIALTLYSVLPILRNTVAGIAGIDPFLVEAGRGVGMTPGQLLRRAELPLAMPVIVAGVRTATVWVVGTATLSTPVGATSLGNFIFSGLQTRNDAAVLVGCVAAALLALLLDQLIRWLEVGLRERRTFSIVAPAAVLLLLFAFAIGSLGAARLGASTAAPLRIGSKTFSEQYVLSEVVAGLADRSGERPEVLSSLGSTVLFDALRQGDIDLYIDYSGTIWATIMKRAELPEDRDQVLREVAAYLEAEHGILLVASLGFENTYALGMRDEQAERLGIRRISELTRAAPGLAIGGDYEFFERAEWRALESTYGLRFREQRAMDAALMYQAVESGDVDVISGYSTDGRIASQDLRLLEDDRGVIPPYDAILLASPRLAAEAPQLIEALRVLEGAIDEETMQRMNFAVDDAGRAPAAVARDFLATLPESAGTD
jgi:osmoprotectant transport system permease protein